MFLIIGIVIGAAISQCISWYQLEILEEQLLKLKIELEINENRYK